MYLSDKTIKKLVKSIGLIEPYDKKYLNPCSYDLTLGDLFLKERGQGCRLRTIKPENPTAVEYEEMDRSVEQITIKPNEFVLATTRETISLPTNLAAQIHGKSSLGRLGLSIQNAGHIDPGFSGKVTLELHNESKSVICLDNTVRICQIIFIPTDKPVEKPYHGKYVGQNDVTAARKEKD